MACTSCQRRRAGRGYIELHALDVPPYGASDIQVYDANDKTIRRFAESDFNNDRHKLFLFFPNTFTPVCRSELGNLNNWIEPFNSLGIDIFAATTDPINAVKEWYETDESLKGSKYKILSSYLLPQRIGITFGSKAKRASVFIMSNGDTVVQEHFLRVGRSLKELHRMAYGYVQDNYCAEGWEDPSDGFLNVNRS